MENILEIKNLSKSYKNFKLENVNFSLEKGYIMGFIGPNGAGKTTTIKLIMNLIKRNSGEIKVFGLDNSLNEKEIKNRIGFVYDECNYFDNLSLKDNAKMIADFYDKWSWSAFDKYLERFGLDKNHKIKELSKGMKTKFAIAAALSHDAELLIMDEPTSGLDPIFRQEIITILQEYIEDGNKSIIFSTHIISDIEKMADYITFINKGQIVFSEEKTRIEDEYRIVKGGLEILNSDIQNSLIQVKKNKFGFSGLTLSADVLRKKYGEKIVIDIPSIEDIMLYMAGERS
ncbi:MAG: ABC transporter ATP-binding protein [Sedimentibacter sp.]|uniref:ABC transporter ATP-binding protein n=1 Tax=Sedimentibacter sp. TaxID=1960295 RepID=UPI003158F759